MNERIDIKAILVDMRQYLMNQFDGFDATLNEMETVEEKRAFLKNCQSLVENGWSDKFDHVEALQIFKPYFTQKGPVMELFTKLFLLKAIYETYNKDRALIENGPQWVEKTRNILSEKFKNLCANPRQKIIFQGKEITNLNDLLEIRRAAQWHIDNRMKVAGALFFLMCISLLKGGFSRDASVNAQIALSVMVSLAGLCVIAFQVKRFFAHSTLSATANLGRDMQRQQGEQAIFTNADIQKFLMISDEEMEIVKKPSQTSRNKK